MSNPLRGRYPAHLVSDSTSSEDSVDSTDSYVQENTGLGLQQCNISLRKKKKCRKTRNKAHLRWINSWPKDIVIEVPNEYRYYCLHTDGYFRKGRRGGHGVIIRNRVGQPIVASAVSVASTEVVSYRYHQLQGMCRGIELAVQYSLLCIELFCNEKHVARLVRRVIRTRNGCKFHSCVKDSDYFDVICQKCVMQYAKEDYQFVFPLLKKIAEMVPKLKQPFMIQKCSRDHNKAADYLAKNGAPGMEVLWPSNFSNEFKKIVCQDYFGDKTHGLPYFV